MLHGLCHCIFTFTEAEYAFQQRKPIIPLMMQRAYRPDGWLGLILGSKLFYDFSGKYSFESRMTGLLKAIQTIHNAPEGKPIDVSLFYNKFDRFIKILMDYLHHSIHRLIFILSQTLHTHSYTTTTHLHINTDALERYQLTL